MHVSTGHLDLLSKRREAKKRYIRACDSENISTPDIAIWLHCYIGNQYKAVNPLRFIMEISKKTARKFIVDKQHFNLGSGGVSCEVLLEKLTNLGCLQLDTINVLERSHYLVRWSRAGSYEKEQLDKLLFPDRRVFEYWAHAACLIPIEYYRFFLHSISKQRKKMKNKAEK